MRPMSMIERVARALARNDGAKITGPARHKASDEFRWDVGHKYMDRYVEAHWREHVSGATFAIEAMREPTEAMLAIGLDKISDDWDGRATRPAANASLECWRAMISAALKGEAE